LAKECKNLELTKHNFQSSNFYREAASHYHFNFPKYLVSIRQSDYNLKNVSDFKQQQQQMLI
jgi:hypothetical protein